MAKGEIKTFPKNGPDPGITLGSGGRNRIRGGASDSGSDQAGGAKGGKSLAGNYEPGKIATVGGIQLQAEVKNAGKSPESGKGPFAPTVKLQKDLGDTGGNNTSPGSMQQGPDGDFGGLPGQSGSKRSDVYRSMV